MSAAIALALGAAATPSYAAFTQTSPSTTQTATIADSTCRQQLDGVLIGLNSAAFVADGLGIAAEAVGAAFIVSEIPGVLAQGAALLLTIAAYAFENDAASQLPYCEETFAGSVVVTGGGTSVTGDSIFNNNLDVSGALGVNGGATISGGATITSGAGTGNSVVVDVTSTRIQSADGTDFVAVNTASGVAMNGNGATSTLNGASASLLNSMDHGLNVTGTQTTLSGGTNSSTLTLMDNQATLGVGTATESEVILINATNSGGGITSVTIGTATAGHTNNLVGGANNIGTTVAGSVNTIGNAGTSVNTIQGLSNTLNAATNTIANAATYAGATSGIQVISTGVDVKGVTNTLTGSTSNTISTGSNAVVTDATSARLANGATSVSVNGTNSIVAAGSNNVTVNGTTGVAANGNGATATLNGTSATFLNSTSHGLTIGASSTTLTGGTNSSVLTLADGDAGGTTLSVGGSVSGSATLFSATTNATTTISTVTIGTATTTNTNNIVGAVNNIGTTVSGSANTIGNAGTSTNTLTGATNAITASDSNTMTAGINNVITATSGSNTISSAAGANQVVTNAAGAATGTAIQGTGTTDGVTLVGTSGGQTAILTLGTDNRYGTGSPAANFSTSGGVPIRVTGVADGVYDFDAVNMRQFTTAVGDLGAALRVTSKFAYSGIASVAAMTGIPDPSPGKRYNFGLGVGQYEGYRAVAAGFKGHVTDNLSVTAGIAFSSMANTYNAGMGFSW